MEKANKNVFQHAPSFPIQQFINRNFENLVIGGLRLQRNTHPVNVHSRTHIPIYTVK